MADLELNSYVEIIPDRFYFTSLRQLPRQTRQAHYFTTDNDLLYEPFFADFGPLNLGCVYKFCRLVTQKLEDERLADRRLIYFSSTDGHRRTNSATLTGLYSVIALNKSPEEAYRPFLGIYPPFIPFRDASMGLSSFNITVLDVLRVMSKAKRLNLFNFDNFDCDEYEYYEKVENGDLNVILPGKLVAFSGPSNVATEYFVGSGIRTMTPEDYGPIFRRLGITAIVRLNKKIYDRRKFLDLGFNHYELYFVDGGTPSNAILERFIEICETEKGSVAVHCKAGLGRTGTLMACYMMKHYRLTAEDCIAFIRVCRPGSIIGPQQQYLKDMESSMWKAGEVMRSSRHVTRALSTNISPVSDTVSVSSRLRSMDLKTESGHTPVSPSSDANLSLVTLNNSSCVVPRPDTLVRVPVSTESTVTSAASTSPTIPSRPAVGASVFERLSPPSAARPHSKIIGDGKSSEDVAITTKFSPVGPKLSNRAPVMRPAK